MLDKKVKDRIIKKFKTHENDTGSTPVQVALLTEEIRELTKHLKIHKKDFSSRRGLIRKVAERRRLLNYFYREDQKGWEDLVKALKLKAARPLTADEESKLVEDEDKKSIEPEGEVSAEQENPENK